VILIYWARTQIPSRKTWELCWILIRRMVEVNAERTKYKFICHHQNVWQNYNIKVANKFFENVTNLV
jgi:hypothetical protein